MNIKYALVLVNIILMFVVVLILFFREKSKSKKVQKEFADLKLSIENLLPWSTTS